MIGIHSKKRYEDMGMGWSKELAVLIVLKGGLNEIPRSLESLPVESSCQTDSQITIPKKEVYKY